MTIWYEPMRQALAHAKDAADEGEVPVGAVVLDPDGQVIASARNLKEHSADPTAHAEIVAIRKACRRWGEGWRLEGCTLVVTLEPCAMCAGAIVAARIERLVFAAFDLKAGAVGSVWDLVRDPRQIHRPHVVSGILAEQSHRLLQSFFERQRLGTEGFEVSCAQFDGVQRHKTGSGFDYLDDPYGAAIGWDAVGDPAVFADREDQALNHEGRSIDRENRAINPVVNDSLPPQIPSILAGLAGLPGADRQAFTMYDGLTDPALDPQTPQNVQGDAGQVWDGNRCNSHGSDLPVTTPDFGFAPSEYPRATAPRGAGLWGKRSMRSKAAGLDFEPSRRDSQRSMSQAGFEDNRMVYGLGELTPKTVREIYETTPDPMSIAPGSGQASTTPPQSIASGAPTSAILVGGVLAFGSAMPPSSPMPLGAPTSDPPPIPPGLRGQALIDYLLSQQVDRSIPIGVPLPVDRLTRLRLVQRRNVSLMRRNRRFTDVRLWSSEPGTVDFRMKN